VVKDARRSEGLFTVWQKDDKVWLELKPEDFDRPLLFSPKLAQGIGEKGLYGGSMRVDGSLVGPQLVQFRRVHRQVQLLAVNTDYTARSGSPAARAVADAFSSSLLASTAVASAEHPQRKTVLVEANALFLGDLGGLGMALQRAFRQGYALDARNSGITAVRARADAVAIETRSHFFAASLALPQPSAGPAMPGAPQPSVPSTVPDPRSMFLGMHYTLLKLPDTPMTPRPADPRVGYFSERISDYTDDLQRTPRQRFVKRWRLEKKDPAAAVSEPVKPITFWLDRNVPLEYRGAITEGVLEWNRAFERIGFRNAVVVRQQSDDADFDTLEGGVASLRWMTNAAASFGAIGPSHTDPRTGEILDADIAFESLSSRSARALRAQVLSPALTVDWAGLLQARDAIAEAGGAPAHLHRAGEACLHADYAAEQLGYALDVLEARGDLDPDGPQVREFVLGYLKDTTMHEVGHTLGLRHNFRSSRVYSERQLSDLEFTTAHSLAGSVMEYAPINLPRPGETGGGTLWQVTLGPYDYWAIEYAYAPLPPGQEKQELRRIAARSSEALLAYGSDEDNFLGVDPESLHFDLGDDPVAFARKRLDIARDLIARQESRRLEPTADYAALRRSIGFAVRDAGRAAGIVARQIGGVRTLRDFPGSGRDPIVPVPAVVQREALDLLALRVFAVDSFRLSPALQRRLAPDFSERLEAVRDGEPVATEFSIDSNVLAIQRTLLAQLLSDGVGSRILDSVGRVDAPGEAFRLSELYARLAEAVWSELEGRGDVSGPRRELQREHVNRIAAMLLRPSAASRADIRSLVRVDAAALLKRIEGALKRPGLGTEARAHLADSADSLRQAISAPLQRFGV
jgi:hypothetical protein